MDRPEPQAVLHETDLLRQIGMFSRDNIKILAHTAPLFEILRSAAKTENEINALLRHMLTERMQNMITFVEHVRANTSFRPGLEIPAAAELVWTLTSPEVYQLLTRDRSYTQEQYADWLQSSLTRLLLP